MHCATLIAARTLPLALVVGLGAGPGLGLLVAQGTQGTAASQGARTDPESPKAIYVFGNPRDRQAFTVWVVSSRAGLTFTDNEPIDVRVRVGGAAASTTVEYTVAEYADSWRTSGTLELETGVAEKTLPLTLPNRGLFKLTVVAKSAAESSRVETSIALVVPPRPSSRSSPWGVFGGPQDYDPADPVGLVAAARSKRLLGASWTRTYYPSPVLEEGLIRMNGTGATASFSIDPGHLLTYAKALHDEGLFVIADLTHVPRMISSRPDDNRRTGDGLPAFATSPPRDYELWDRYVQALVTKYRGLVQVWQVGNEPELPQQSYWRGTPEEFVEFVRRSAEAIRKADPSALVAAPGSTGYGHDYTERLLQLGIVKDIDLFSVHYTDDNPSWMESWRALFDKYRVKIPIWNTEERSAIPFNNIIAGQGPSMKFLHVEFGYHEYRNLVRMDLTVMPPGIAYSVGSYFLGDARWTGRSDRVDAWTLDFFERSGERIAVFRAKPAPAKLFDDWKRATSARLRVQPAVPGVPVTATDIWGRSRTLQVDAGLALLPLDQDLLFVNGARALDVDRTEVTRSPRAMVIEAESGKWSAGWRVNPRGGYSENSVLEIWAVEDPGPDGYWAELTFNIGERGEFDLVFAGTTLAGLESGNRWLSPFEWRLDDGPAHMVETPLEVVKNVAGAPEGISTLTSVNLGAGRHTFRLRLLGKADQPEKRWAMWFDAIALLRKAR